jgi:hypothetical protein
VLFPSTDGQNPDHLFADRYTQTIAFALLLARIENVPLADRNFGDVARELKAITTPTFISTRISYRSTTVSCASAPARTTPRPVS